MSANLITRIIVAVIFGPLIIAIGYLGGGWLMGLVLLLSTIGIIEFLINSRFKPSSALFWVALVSTAAMVTVSMLISVTASLTLFVIFFLTAGMISAAESDRPLNLFARLTTLTWGVAYIGFLYPFIYHLHYIMPPKGGDWLLFLFGTIWLSDTIAMWVGKSMGHRKFAPHISPGKTVEGFLGGLFGGLIVGMILGFWRLSDIIMVLLLFTGVIISFVGQLGDLVESIWKRSLGIKDSSGIIPGHGGILDRFDSLLFAAPALYLILKYLIYG